MKLIISLIACAVLSLPATALAASGEDPSINVSAQKEAHPYLMFNQEYRAYKGAYSLSNGKVLHLTGSNHSMTAQIDDQPPHRIVATSSNSFAAVGGHVLAVTLDVSNPDAVTGEVVYVDESRRNTAWNVEPELVRVAFR